MRKLRILAVEPFYGGSHKAFLDGWIRHSCHDFTVISLPDNNWRWRMRSAAITAASEAACLGQFDLIFCSSLLNLAEFSGLLKRSLRALPSVAFFHENQLTYPVRSGGKRDANAVLSNLKSAMSASECWWNSAFNRNSFFDALPEFLELMPEPETHQTICLQADEALKKSIVMPLGIEQFPECELTTNTKPLHIVWAARWEHDKQPEDILRALMRLKELGVDFRISLLGEKPIHIPPIFETARNILSDNIADWGYLPSREEYLAVLRDADVIVSTSNHEFFGISVLEAVSAGAYPLLPDRLVYPEIFCDDLGNKVESFFYDGSLQGLVNSLQKLAVCKEEGDLWSGVSVRGTEISARYRWELIARNLDERAVCVCNNAGIDD